MLLAFSWHCGEAVTLPPTRKPNPLIQNEVPKPDSLSQATDLHFAARGEGVDVVRVKLESSRHPARSTSWNYFS
jgi:hypothetical protein